MSQCNKALEGPLIKAVGENVTFKLITPPSEKPRYINWNFKGANASEIIVIVSGHQLNPVYADRIFVDESTGSLELMNLILSDTGEYILSFFLGQEEGRTSLQVFGKCTLHTMSRNCKKKLHFYLLL